MMRVIIVGAGSSISTTDLKFHTDVDSAIANQDFEPPGLPSLPDVNYELDYTMLPDPIGISEYFIVKSKTNPFKSICEWHSQLYKQSGGNYRKVIYWMRVRSLTWAKCKKVNPVQVNSVTQLIILIAIIVQL
jgi:hypothetical protein